MFWPKKETNDSLQSFTINHTTFVEQTQIKLQQTIEPKLNKPLETFLFTPPILIQGSCMIRLTYLEVYLSICNITLDCIKFKFL